MLVGVRGGGGVLVGVREEGECAGGCEGGCVLVDVRGGGGARGCEGRRVCAGG